MKDEIKDILGKIEKHLEIIKRYLIFVTKLFIFSLITVLLIQIIHYLFNGWNINIIDIF